MKTCEKCYETLSGEFKRAKIVKSFHIFDFILLTGTISIHIMTIVIEKHEKQQFQTENVSETVAESKNEIFH